MLRKISMLAAPEGTAGEGGAKDTTGAPPDKTIIATPKDTTGGGEGGGKSMIDDHGGEGGQGGTTQPEGDKGEADPKLKIPEGVDEKTAAPYLAAAKKHGLKGEAAQEFFDLALKAGESSRKALEGEISSMWAKTQADWLEQAKQDKEFGGAKFKDTIAMADKFVLRFGGDGLMDALSKSGLGKHPEVIKAFAKAGAAISEDSIAGTTSGSQTGGPMSEKQKLQQKWPASPEMWKHLPD